ncbi:hypothetical protein [Pseudodesulfovibrio indicus]|uniref:DUF4079 domain-containing protein n=1 Tax=Pseudodesulfovibrio indicus TaxID=1716143 RepID=A0A126QSB7_9BACT|nr:hypothetical protein [Pseudodesulfovibrio indicus]AMK12616.1 hypothetical protein AWY79_16640 [Pseudodesulfovibrio indicus]TDT90928.1 hypothetical protein EDC59_102362 [Pseudodesulfovibrio indicus]
MLWIHPLLQFAALLLAVHVLLMGINRFRFQHLKRKCAFNWKRHVLLGKWVAWMWLAGLVLGLYMAVHSWGALGLTGPHYQIGLWMTPFILVGLVTGFILQKPSGKRPAMALTHGAANAIAFVLALYQTWSGVEAVRLLLLD